MTCSNGESQLCSCTGHTPKDPANGPTAVRQQQQQLYVLQCVSKLADGNESDSGDSTSDQASNTDDVQSTGEAVNGSVIRSAAASETHSKPGIVEGDAAANKDATDDGTPQQALGRLEYVLRLSRLEAVEGVTHTSISEVRGAA